MSQFIHANSFRSFFIEMKFNDILLATGTAFFCQYNEHFLLFTNKHNVTGKNSLNGELLSNKGAIPNSITLTLPNMLNEDEMKSEGRVNVKIPLYTDDSMSKHLWIEHPNEKVDVVGIVCDPSEHINIEKIVFQITNEERDISIGQKINVIGYPFGLSADRFPLWLTGYLSSEPNIDFDNLPLMLIDCRTRKGQSGSPVIQSIKKGELIENKGRTYKVLKESTYFLGIYSGRINNDSDIGRVWKRIVLKEIIEINMADDYELSSKEYKKDSEYLKSIETLKLSIEINEKFNLKSKIAMQYHDLALLYQSELLLFVNNIQKCFDSYDKALALEKELNNLEKVAKIYANYGSAAHGAGIYKAAADLYKKALETFTRIDNFQDIEIVNNLIKKNNEKMG
ncbi:hypothetical protein ACH5BK_07215 [Arcobacter sp. YIC-80]|uniref:hypothetical protein n=1 Tax=Arcobacter sp. YIC-80 TaxID=3376683 RepID=UPI00384A7D6D